MKKKSSGTSVEDINWDEEKAEKIIEEVKKKLLESQNTILECFHLTSFDIEAFVEKVNEGEVTE